MNPAIDKDITNILILETFFYVSLKHNSQTQTKSQKPNK